MPNALSTALVRFEHIGSASVASRSQLENSKAANGPNHRIIDCRIFDEWHVAAYTDLAGLSLAFPEIYPVKQMFSISLKNRVEKICTSENGTHVELGLAYSENSKFTSAPHAPAVGQRLDGHVARSSAALFNRVSRISTRGLLESRKSSSIRRAGELYRLAALFHRGVVPRPFHRVRFDFFTSPPTSSGTPRHSPSATRARRPRRPPTRQRILPPNT